MLVEGKPLSYTYDRTGFITTYSHLSQFYGKELAAEIKKVE